jgi:hypothetical protein
VPHYHLERDLADEGVPLDRGTVCRYMEQAGNTLGATIVHAMWGGRDRERAGDLDGRDGGAHPTDQGVVAQPEPVAAASWIHLNT